MNGKYRILCASIAALFCLNCSVAQEPKPVNGVSGSVEISNQDSSNDLSLTVGKSVLVDFSGPVQRVAVGLSDIAEATATSPTELMVNGKTPGQTSLIVWQRDGQRQFFNVMVRAGSSESNDRLSSVRRELNMELPGQPIKVSSENGFIFLRGTVKDLASADRAVAIASSALVTSATGVTGKVVNLLYVDVPPAEKQILLKVRFTSVDRNKAKQLGINLISLGLGNSIGGVTTGQFSPPSITTTTTSSGTTPTATFSNELNILALLPGRKAGADIQALETKGVVETLAEPNVLAANGKQASFLAGGEYPYPVAQGGSAGTAPTITIMFKEYGVRLNFIPTITPRGTIRLQVAPEVSALDFTNSIQVSGFNVPAITSRKVNTEAELADGQTFVISGLLDNRETETLEKIPFIGDVPVLGKLFQSMSKNRTNTELLVMVTPEIVNPIPAGAALPDLNYPVPFLPPNSTIPMSHPVDKKDGTAPSPASPMPQENLIESQKPEKRLAIEGSYTSTGSGSSPN